MLSECVLSLRWKAKVTLVSHHEVRVGTPVRNVSQQTSPRREVLNEAFQQAAICRRPEVVTMPECGVWRAEIRG
jgi:hypothetical protein